VNKILKPLVLTTTLSLVALTQSCQSPFAQQQDNSNLLSQAEIIPPPKARPTLAYKAPVEKTAVNDLESSFPTEGTGPSLFEPEVTKAHIEPEIITPAIPPAKVEKLTYRVRKGDSLWKIAFRHGVSVNELTAENGLNSKKALAIGVTLTIPAGGRMRSEADMKKVQARKKTSKASVKTTKATPKSPTISGETYKVKAGDSLWVIARKAKTSVKALKEINNLTSSRLKIGQILILKKSSSNIVVAEAPKPEPEDEPLLINNSDEEAKVDNTDGTDTSDKGVDEGTSGEPASAEIKLNDMGRVVTEHTVTADDTLEAIAENYNSTIGLIKKHNPSIKSNADLVENMELKVPLLN
jgi:LysM repeat protein